jgi:hypothetical protein
MMAVGLVSSHGLKASKLEALDDIARYGIGSAE